MEIFHTLVNQLDDEEVTIGYCQQDGATSHTSYVNLNFSHAFFRTLASTFAELKTAFFFSLWGYLTGRAYGNKPRTLVELQSNIRQQIDQDILARTFPNVEHRVQACLDANGGHFQ